VLGYPGAFTQTGWATERPTHGEVPVRKTAAQVRSLSVVSLVVGFGDAVLVGSLFRADEKPCLIGHPYLGESIDVSGYIEYQAWLRYVDVLIGAGKPGFDGGERGLVFIWPIDIETGAAGVISERIFSGRKRLAYHHKWMIYLDLYYRHVLSASRGSEHQ
jgi:hypothetical protein